MNYFLDGGRVVFVSHVCVVVIAMGKEVKKLPSHMFVLLKVQSPLGKGFENIRSYPLMK